MADYAQTAPLKVTTPLGANALLLTGFEGTEALSELFHFDLELQAEIKTAVPFEKLIGQSVTVEMSVTEGKPRYFNGIVNQLTQMERDNTFTGYRAQVVPKFWLLTQNVQSRIFQQKSVPDILRVVLADLDVSFELLGTYPAHNYCVQMRESDFDFASRLMEEEGIFYYFTHTADGHKLILADASLKNPRLPGQNSFVFDNTAGGRRAGNRIHRWRKTQRLGTARHLLWDHCFQLPGKSLEAKQSIPSSVQAGKVSHQLQVAANENLQIYDHPGGYAHRFDDVDSGGGEQAEQLSNVYKDNRRTVGLRAEQMATGSVTVEGASDCGEFVPGFVFALTNHFDGDGDYLLTKVTHSAKSDSYRSATQGGASYANRFWCIPSQLVYRPPLKTPEPSIMGTQTATVVGPAGEEIFTDKYGRVKVQFHWDRFGQNNINSSCWLRVLSSSAGGNWGSIHLPRVGHEVVVAFHEGDPDLPYIAGSVYNAGQMPPFSLPDNRTRSGFKSHSRKGGAQNFSGIVFEDQQDAELLQLHSEKDMMVNAENNHVHNVANQHSQHIGKAHFRTVGGIPGTSTTPTTGSGSGGGEGGGRQRIRIGKSRKDKSPSKPQRQPILPAPRGSGQGGGDSLDYTSSVDWDQATVSGEIGFSYSLTVGAEVGAVVGWSADTTIGSCVSVSINPGGALGYLGPSGMLAVAALGGIAAAATGALVGGLVDGGMDTLEDAEWAALIAGTAAVGGTTDVIFGAEKALTYGPQFECKHGNSFSYDSELTLGTGAMAAATAASFVASAIIPGVLPNEGASTLTGLGITDLNAIMLEGLWLVESLAATAEAEEKKAKEAAALAAQPKVVPPPTVDELIAAAEKRVNDAISTVAQSVAQTSETVTGLQKVNTVSGDYTINADNVSINTSVSSMTGGLFDATDACNINLTSLGIADNGSISATANGQISMTSGYACVTLQNTGPEIGDLMLTTGAEGIIAMVRGALEDWAEVPSLMMEPAGVTLCGGMLPVTIVCGEVTIDLIPESGTIVMEAPNIELIAEELISFTVDDTELALDAEGIQMLAATLSASHELEVDEEITAKSKICAEDSEEDALKSVL